MIVWLLALSLVGPAHAVHHFDHHQDVISCGLCFHGDHQQHALLSCPPTLSLLSVQIHGVSYAPPSPDIAPQAAISIRGPPRY